MPFAMVMLLSLEMFPAFPVWHNSPTFPISFSVLHMAFLCGGRSISPLFFVPHFPLSPFPFPLSPFPFSLSPFPKYTNKLSAQTTKIRIKLKLSHTLVSTTGVQLFSKRGGLCFVWRLFSLGGGGGGGGAGNHPIVGGGDGWRGFPVKNLVWTTADGGVDLGIVSLNFL